MSASGLETWLVFVRSGDDLFGPGTLTLGDGTLELEAPELDHERLRRAGRVRLWLFAVGVVAIFAGVADAAARPGLFLSAFVLAAAGLVFAMRRWHATGKHTRRWSVAELSDVRMSDDSDSQVGLVLAFGWLGLLFRSALPQRWLQFETGDAGSGFEVYVVDVGSAVQFVEVATKLRSMEESPEVSLL